MAHAAALGHRIGAGRERSHALPPRRPSAQPIGGHPLAWRRSDPCARGVPRHVQGRASCASLLPPIPLTAMFAIRVIVGGLVAVILYLVVQESLPQSQTSITKDAVLRGTIRGAIVPRYTAMRVAFEHLANACDACAQTPADATLRKAQETWRDALLAWKAALTMPAGPLTEHGYVDNVHFWPIRPASIE